MRFYIYGSTETTNNRIGLLRKVLNMEKIKYYGGGGKSNKPSKIFDLIKLFFCDTLYMGPFSHSNIRVMKMAKLLRKKVIVDYYASYFDMNVVDRKMFLPESDKGQQQLFVDRMAADLADRLMFLNHAECDYYLSATDCIEHKNKACIVPLVIEDRKKASLSYYKDHDGVFNIVFCGTYIPLHGIQVIIDAIDILAHNHSNFRLYLWGNKNTVQASSKYRYQVKERELGAYITFINDWDKENYYTWCVDNCALMLGVFGESEKAYTVVPNKVVDALAFGIPCITGESKGCREFFDGKNDVLIVSHTAKDLADAISNFMEDNYLNIAKRVDLTEGIYEKYFSEKAFAENIKKLMLDT